MKNLRYRERLVPFCREMGSEFLIWSLDGEFVALFVEFLVYDDR